MIVRKLEALFTINTNALQFKRAASELDNLANKAETVMKAIAGYWAVQALQNLLVNTATAMSEIGKTASYLGIASDALQELRYAAEKSGVSVDALDDALKELQIRAVDASTGQGEAAEAFLKLGFNGSEAADRIREPLEMLDIIADRLKEKPNADRLWLADAIFGDEGSRILFMLKDGSSGLQAIRKEARSLGYVLDNEAVTNAERFTRSLKRLNAISLGKLRNVTASLLGPLASLSDGLSRLMETISRFEFSKATSGVIKTGFLGSLALAAVKATATLGPLLPLITTFLRFAGKMALRATGWGAILLLAQDIWSMFSGADSVTSMLASYLDQPLKKLEVSINNVWQNIAKGFQEAFASMNKEFDRFSLWLLGGMQSIEKRIGALFKALVPDFLTTGIAATIKYVGGSNALHTPQDLNARLAPASSSILNQNRLSSNQNISVAVNVRSQANPHEIGGEVSKAIKQALERERFNAFMGVMNYAG